MKLYADKYRKYLSSNDGNWVYLKLQHYKKSSVEPRSHHKLSKQYFGPYQILKKLGLITYEVQLPPATRLHPVFHIPKEHNGDIALQLNPLPPDFIRNKPIIRPAAILNSKLMMMTLRAIKWCCFNGKVYL